MLISTVELEKKYTGNVIFSRVNLNIPQGTKFAIIGHNGSGKTTLLQILAGLTLPSSGKVDYAFDSKSIEADKWYSHFVFCSPYQEIIEEFNAVEISEFHFSLKKISPSLSINTFLETVMLDKEKTKPIKYYSTGMKQRLKLGLAICSDYPLLFLDEPTSNLDKTNFNWFLEMIKQFASSKTVILSSNQPDEYSFCNQNIDIMEYKTSKK